MGRRGNKTTYCSSATIIHELYGHSKRLSIDLCTDGVRLLTMKYNARLEIRLTEADKRAAELRALEKDKTISELFRDYVRNLPTKK